MTDIPRVPQLLVSVRDVDEACCAATAGVDILDFKQPDRGPLGRVEFAVIAAAADALADLGSSSPPLSAALGEVIEAHSWSASESQVLPPSLKFLKLGLSGLGQTSDWISRWLEVRSVVERQVRHPVRWVAVAYADVATANAPSVEAVVEAAIGTGCAGVLIDTFDKSHGRLLDYLDAQQLYEVGRRIRRSSVFFAIAGRLRAEDINRLQAAEPDIIAVRSAVCAGDDRCAAISPARVAKTREQIRCTFAQLENSPNANRPALVSPPAD